MPPNLLFYGDNLDVLRRHVHDETVDLVYLDPPFNSNATYNVLFAERDGSQVAAQIRAFEDTWAWDEAAIAQFHQTVEAGGRVSEALQAFKQLLAPRPGKGNSMLAYLTMMAPRLVELRRVLKPTGSIYLHCDPTASHYLKVLMDAVFGPEGYLGEVIWKRTSAHSSSLRYGPVHDTLLFYSKSKTYVWNPLPQAYDPSYVDTFFDQVDSDGRRWKRTDLTGAGIRHGETGLAWRGIDVTAKGRHWSNPPSVLDKLDAEGRIHWPAKAGGMPRLKQYPEDLSGVPLQDVWNDIRPMHNLSAERLGYPTQKPEALLERVIRASSNEGDLVLDPFCGCGTAIVAAQKLGRRWIGIDVTHLAIGLIKRRLQDSFGSAAAYETIGEPTTPEDAADLAASDPWQFQWWALGLVGARPAEQKKGADKGIDGRIYFFDDPRGKTKQVILSVKAGAMHAHYIRDLRGVLDREQAELGVLISLHPPTQLMRAEAASAGYYHSPIWQRDFPRLQLLTVADLLDGRSIDMPPLAQVGATFRKAPKAGVTAEKQLEL
jgi:DNA modification methylase